MGTKTYAANLIFISYSVLFIFLFSVFFEFLQMINSRGLRCSCSKCQLIMLLPDQFNKRTTFQMISISCPYSNLILEVTCFLTCNFEEVDHIYVCLIFLTKRLLVLSALNPLVLSF